MRKLWLWTILGLVWVIGMVVMAGTFTTNWMNVDWPSWVGDYELTKNPCWTWNSLISVEVQASSSTWSFVYSWWRYDGFLFGKYIHVYGPLYTGDTQRGVYCVNTENAGSCIDYKVRFVCEQPTQTRSWACIGLPANASWNTTSRIRQYSTWWANWYPGLTGVYNVNRSTWECRFTCNSGYVFTWGLCL